MYDHVVFRDTTNQSLLVDIVNAAHTTVLEQVEKYPEVAVGFDIPLMIERLIRESVINTWPQFFTHPTDHTVEKDIPCTVSVDIDQSIEIRTCYSAKHPHTVRGRLPSTDRNKQTCSKSRSSFLLFISFTPLFDYKTKEKNDISHIREISFGYVPEHVWKQEKSSTRIYLTRQDKAKHLMTLYRWEAPRKKRNNKFENINSSTVLSTS